MATITLAIAPADIDEAIRAHFAGTPLDRACPIAVVAQRQIERVVRVFRNAWHLAGREKVPSTLGERLTGEAAAFVAAFDTWARAVRSSVRVFAGDVDRAIAETAGRPDGLTLTLTLPERAIEKSKAPA